MSRGSRLVAGQGVFLVAVAALVVLTLSSSPHVASLRAQPPTDVSAELLDGTLQRYCVTCHNDRLRTADLSLVDLDLTQVGTHAELWEGVVAKTVARMARIEAISRSDAPVPTGSNVAPISSTAPATGDSSA